MSNYILYRDSTLGKCLSEVLDEYVEEGLITKQLALKVLTSFDRNINNALADETKHKVHFVADKLSAYRFCDNVWTLIMKGVHFNDTTRQFDSLDTIKTLKFVAMDGRSGSDAGRRALGNL